jgi:hypothetical protein
MKKLGIFYLLLHLLMLSNLCAQEEAINIGNRLEIFIEKYLIADMKGYIELRLHHPVRREIAIVHDEPWEGSGCGYHTVFKDGDKYRMYYKAWHIPSKGSQANPVVIAYAESKDGIVWVKPNLGLVEFNGSKQNNIIIDKIMDYGCHDFSPFIDTNPKASTETCYKAIGANRGTKKDIFGFVSSDGIHWKLVQDQPIFLESGWVFDSQNIAFWSDYEQQYVMYYRRVVNEVRMVARAVSKDFVHWKKEGLIKFENGEPTKQEQFYVSQIRPYFRAPHIYIGFPARYVDRGWTAATRALPSLDLRLLRAKTQQRYGTAVTDALIITSRDGLNFHRWDEEFIRPGLRTLHNWAYGDNYIAWHIVETESVFDDQPNELSLYATESYFTGNSSRLRRYTLRVDGFASMHASHRGGEFTTKPVIFNGSEMKLNFSTSAAGSVRIEIQDQQGNPIKGFNLADCPEIFGDAIDYSVKWNDGRELSAIAGKVVHLRFVLKEADVYAFRFCKKKE